jgi:2-oxoglutarate ferredoxin oxidoreductase subunit gamma
MQAEVMFAGFGGQGILLSAKILAHAALEQGLEVAWVPSYGPEMRGGTAYCLVVMGNRPIGSPVIRNPLHLVAMNRPSLEKFAPMVKPGGVILGNSSLIPHGSGRCDVRELLVPVNEIAIKIGSIRSANIVALSSFVSVSEIISYDILRNCIKEEFASKSELLSLNLTAAEEGRKLTYPSSP